MRALECAVSLPRDVRKDREHDEDKDRFDAAHFAGYRFVAASGVTGLPVAGAAGFASCVLR
jgi:hypothetical protein